MTALDPAVASIVKDLGPIPAAPLASAGLRRTTDDGNALRFVDDHLDQLRYCPPLASWFVWDGARFARDDRGKAVDLGRALARRLRQEQLDREVPGESDAERRKRMAAALGLESSRSIRAMLDLARHDQRAAVIPDDLDRDPWALNVANGTLDLRTGRLRAHRPSDLFTKLAAAAYHPEADAPTWAAFLERILPDPDVRRFVKASLGYALTGVIAEHHLWLGWGSGANGKTTLLDAVMRILGDYAQAAPPELIAPTRDEHPTVMADLAGARLVVTSELDDGRRLAEATVKRLTGGDPVKARYMRQDLFEFRPTWHLWCLTNHRPRVGGTDHALWRRLRLVPFTVTVPDDEQDRSLPDKLQAEADGILTWLVEGCRVWQQDGLGEPLAVRMATDDYRAGQDTIGAYLADRCSLNTGHTATAADLYAAYRTWAEAAGERVISQRRFGEGLAERGLERYRTSKEHRWRGVALGDPMTLVTPESA